MLIINLLCSRLRFVKEGCLWNGICAPIHLESLPTQQGLATRADAFTVNEINTFRKNQLGHSPKTLYKHTKWSRNPNLSL